MPASSSRMRHESPQSAYSDVDELDRPLYCGPVFRLRGIYPRFSSYFTCMCLRHTVSSAIRILGKRSRFLAQPQVAVFLPSHSRAVSASKCRDANSASFHSDECWKRANIPPLSYRQALRKPGLLFFPVDTGLYCFFPSLSFSALQLRNGRSLPISAQSSMTREWDFFDFWARQPVPCLTYRGRRISLLFRDKRDFSMCQNFWSQRTEMKSFYFRALHVVV